jgi:ribosome-associated protein
VVIASGDSNRQVKALADRVQERIRELGSPVYGVEGEKAGEWVLVDLGDVVVHIMHPAVREFYNLEEVWGGKTVRVNAAAGKKKPAAKKRAKAKRPRSKR